MSSLLQKIKSLFKIATVQSSNNVGDFLQGQFIYMGSNSKGQIFIPYGTIGAPPNNSMAAVFSQNGNESNNIGFASDPKNRIKPDAEPGEHGIANYVSRSFIFIYNDGTIEISSENDIIITASGKMTVTIPEIEITGNVTINGKLVNNGVEFSPHVHSQANDSGGNTEQNTGVPE